MLQFCTVKQMYLRFQIVPHPSSRLPVMSLPPPCPPCYKPRSLFITEVRLCVGNCLTCVVCEHA